MALGDVDADGDLDALLGSVLYLNDSTGRYTDVSQPGAPPFVSGVFAVGDKVVRYLLPVEWVGFVSIAIGFESLALSQSCGLAKA